jgi:hypothetical protein
MYMVKINKHILLNTFALQELDGKYNVYFYYFYISIRMFNTRVYDETVYLICLKNY